MATHPFQKETSSLTHIGANIDKDFKPGVVYRNEPGDCKALTLAKSLNSIWYVNDTESENKQPIVERRDVKSLCEHYLNEGVELSDIPDYISDNSLECEMDEFILGSDSAFDEMLSTCNKKGQLAFDDVIQSQLGGRAFDTEQHYVELCHRIGTALGIDTLDKELNPDHWCISWLDNFTPYQAVLKVTSPF